MSIAINIICVVFLLVIIFWTQFDFIINKSEKMSLLGTYLLIIVVLGTEIVTTLTDNGPMEYRAYSTIANTIMFAVAPFVPLMNAQVFMKNVSKKRRLLPMIVPAINAVFALSSPVTGFLFHVSRYNMYTRGPLYMVYVIAGAFGIIYLTAISLSRVTNCPTQYLKLLVACQVVLYAGIAVQIIFPQLHVAWLAVTVCVLVEYLFLSQIHSMIDGVTEAFNRMAFNRQIDNIFETGHTKGITLIMADLDDFKAINDKHGHLYGDHCLKTVADTLKSSFIDNATIYRYGGDEFIIICRITLEHNLQDQIDYFKDMINAQHASDKKFPNVSLGYSIYRDGDSIADLMNRTDQQMYNRKNRKYEWDKNEMTD